MDSHQVLHCTVVAAELVESHSDVLLPGGDQAGRLPDELDRVAEHDAEEVLKNRAQFPNEEAVFKLL